MDWKRIAGAGLFAFIGLFAVACGGGNERVQDGKLDGSGLSGKLVLTGSSTCAPVLEEAGKRFEKLHPGVRIDVQSGGTGKGISDVTAKTAQIGMGSRELMDEEKNLIVHPFAIDGVCMIIHKENPVKELTNEQIVGIYTGKVTNWKDVGGSDAKITVVNKAKGRATLEVFTQYFKVKSQDIKAAVEIGENEHGIKTVAGDPNAIGYVSIGTAEYNAQAGTAIKLLPAGGVPATTASLAEGKFPISRRLLMITLPEIDATTKAFVEYCQSKEIHDIIKSQYFVPVAR